jgi:DNA polymerase-3 subunit alpha
MHTKYRDAKSNPDKTCPWYKYTKSTYGTLIYQEQGMPICREIGGMGWDDTDKLVKADFLHIPSDVLENWKTQFYAGAKQYGLSKAEMEELFYSLTQYSFNRGHGVAYAMLSAELMYFRVHYPLLFWYSTLKYENKEDKLQNQESLAIEDGCIVLLPHVNQTAEYSITKYDGEDVIVKGLSSIKNVGDKAAEAIEADRRKNGDFTDVREFKQRMSSRSVNSRCIEALINEGALEFNRKKYLNRTEKYNLSLLNRR